MTRAKALCLSRFVIAASPETAVVLLTSKGVSRTNLAAAKRRLTALRRTTKLFANDRVWRIELSITEQS